MNTNTADVLKRQLRNYSMFLVLVGIAVIFSLITEGVNLRPRNITNIIIQNSYILVLAIGMVLVIITGNIDLSVGSVAAFTGAVSAMLYNTGIGFPLALLLTIFVGALIGAFQGFWIAYRSIPSFIVTLAGMLLFRGLTYIITDISPIGLDGDSFKKIASGFLTLHKPGSGIDITSILIGIAGCILLVLFRLYRRKVEKKYQIERYPWAVERACLVGEMFVMCLFILYIAYSFASYRGIPLVAILLFVLAGSYEFIAKKTVFGRHIYAVGGNAAAAKLAGIASERVVFFTFVNMGALAGVAGVVFTAYLNSALPQSGNLFELDAIAAVFIGGASMGGGVGTIIGAITGGLVMGLINNGMSLMNLGAEYQYVVKACVLLLAVWYDLYTRKKY